MVNGPTGGIVLTAQLSAWKFETERYQGSCKLSHEPCHVRLTLDAEAINVLPDVCAVETWFEQRAKEGPVTCEELAVEAAEKWRARATVVLESHMHGPITATAG